MDCIPKIKMFSITLDTDDVHKLADFYAALLGWEKRCDHPEFIEVSAQKGEPFFRGEHPFIWIQENRDYKPPVWPEEPEAQQQMVHIDFVADDIDNAIRHAMACGAKKAATQYSERWTVMFDPAGHPFCLCELKPFFSIKKERD